MIDPRKKEMLDKVIFFRRVIYNQHDGVLVFKKGLVSEEGRWTKWNFFSATHVGTSFSYFRRYLECHGRRPRRVASSAIFLLAVACGFSPISKSSFPRRLWVLRWLDGNLNAADSAALCVLIYINLIWSKSTQISYLFGVCAADR